MFINSKIFKLILKPLLAILFLGLCLIIAVITIIDPNRIKVPLQKQIAAQYQRQVDLKGPIRWVLSPCLSWEATDIAVENTTELNEKFLSLKKIRLIPHFWSLVTGKLLVDIEIQGLHLNLERNRYHQSNWEDLLQKISQTNLFSKNNRIIYSGLKIKDSTIQYQNEIDKQHYYFKDFQLSSGEMYKGVIGIQTPFTVSGRLEDELQNTLATLQLNAAWDLNPNTLLVKVDNIELTSKFQHLRPMTLLGSLEIHDLLHAPTIEGKVEVKNFDLSTTLPNNFFNNASAWVGKKWADISGDFHWKDPWLEFSNVKIELDDGGVLEGRFRLDPDPDRRVVKLFANIKGNQISLNPDLFSKKAAKKDNKNSPSHEPLLLDSFHTTIALDAGVLNISPLIFEFANGKHQATFQANFNTHVPHYTLTHQGDNYEVQELLTIFGIKHFIEGRAISKLDISAAGDSMESFYRTLNGQAEFLIQDGKLHGIDLISLLEHSQLTLKSLFDNISKKEHANIITLLKDELNEWRKQASASAYLNTPFETAKTSFNIKNGVINNHDLSIVHTKYRIDGHGTLDLNNDMIHGQVSTWLKYMPAEIPNELSVYFKEVPLTVMIKGPYYNPAIRPNLEQYTANALKLTKKVLTENDEQGFGKLFVNQ